MPESAFIRIDQRAFPVVFAVYPRGGSKETIDAYAAELELVYQRGRFSGITNIENVVGAAPQLRKYLASRIDELTTRYPGVVVSEAVVARSPLLRGTFAAYSWLKRDRSYASRAFSSYSDALAWTRHELKKAGIDTPFEVQMPIL